MRIQIIAAMLFVNILLLGCASNESGTTNQTIAPSGAPSDVNSQNTAALSDYDLSTKAEQTFNVSYCAMIKDKHNFGDTCYDILAVKLKNISLCDQMEFTYSCYGSVAAELGDPTICVDKIPIDPQPGYRNTCNYGVAIATLNDSLCDRISDQSMNGDCKVQIQNKKQIAATTSGQG